MKLIGNPIQRILQTAVGALGAPVSDNTGLTGTFDIDLRWSTDVAPADDAQPFVTALRDQLGLKLERQRVTADAFIVDRMERPAPD